jgi:hypothetical protein
MWRDLMARLVWLVGGALLVIACAGAPANIATSTPPTVGPTLAPQPTATPPPAVSSAPTDVPSPSASGDVSGSAGERITIGDYQYVTMLNAEYSTEGYSEIFKPDEGNAIYAFELEFEGLDPSGSSYNPLYFDLVVGGVEYSNALLGAKEPTLGSGELDPGATASGWLSFEAPLADEIVLRYEPVLGLAGNSVEWLVTVRS